MRQFLLLFGLPLVCVMAGCGTPDEDSVTTTTYWRTLTGSAGDAQDELVKKFNEQHPESHVASEFQGSYAELRTKLLAAASVNEGPEVSQLGTYEILEMAEAGLLVDLLPFAKGPDGIDRSEWPGGLGDAGNIAGYLFWVPFNVSVPILYYNEEAFTKAGLDGPPTTWVDFYEYARKLTVRDEQHRVTQVGLAIWDDAWPLISAIWSEGGELTDPSYSSITLNDPAAVAVLTEFQKLIQEGSATLGVGATGGHRALFKQGGAAMILDSPAPFDEIFTQSSGFTPAVAAFPAGTNGRVYAPGGGGLVMLRSTPVEKRAAAWQFIKFMLEPEQLSYYAKRTGYVAYTKPSKAMLGNLLEDKNRAAVYSAVPFIRADFSFNMNPAIREPFVKAYQQAFVQGADVRKALDDADSEAEARNSENRPRLTLPGIRGLLDSAVVVPEKRSSLNRIFNE
jgi:sn-glycerol 3-phosphate transport system substrate-binding protein